MPLTFKSSKAITPKRFTSFLLSARAKPKAEEKEKREVEVQDF
jgi:hypothetical protein